jgi:hypothetical protein
VSEIPISPHIPDSQIQTVKIITPLEKQRQSKRNSRYLAGPINLSWIREHIKSPADRLLLVLCAHSTMANSSELKVSSAILKDAGIVDRKVAYRAIASLEKAGELTADRHSGRRVVLKLLTHPSKKLGSFSKT